MDDEEHFTALLEPDDAAAVAVVNADSILFRDDDDEMDCRSAGSCSMDSDSAPTLAAAAVAENAPPPPPPPPLPAPQQQPVRVDPEPHISSQFYTFNPESHSLMVRCITQGRLATADEIRAATPAPVLASWRGVWKDRNEDTAYLTGWRRIQDKLGARIDHDHDHDQDHHDDDDEQQHGRKNELLFFKNNPSQLVPHVGQWQEIVLRFHGDADLRHLGLRDTLDRIKQFWTVGHKFYGIPESFVRVCLTACPVCSDSASSSGAGAAGGSSSAAGLGGRSKRRRFEYTDSFEVPAREVPARLQQLAAKHQVVLCIRQKYIRYKPFMAEVKDYACHRAGEPNAKRSGSSASSGSPSVLKRERYASKRCGCGFRIRAIVPITNYNEKEKSFAYQEEGKATFKLYAVHSGHEPGPHEGAARVIHRFIDHSAAAASAAAAAVDHGDEARMAVAEQVQELRSELAFLDSKIASMSHEALAALSHELCAITQRIRAVDAAAPPAAPAPLLASMPWVEEDPSPGDGEHTGDDKPYKPSFEGLAAEWDDDKPTSSAKSEMLNDCDSQSKWMESVKDDFDEKSILVSSKEEDLDVGMQVDDSFYPENPKWYCGLDPSADDLGHSALQDGFRHGGIA